MRSVFRLTVLLGATMSLAWHGVFLLTPHDHADRAVPQEELACSASRPSSESNHLHGSGRLLTPHPCVACLVGSTVADTPGIAAILDTGGWSSAMTPVSRDLRARLHGYLPQLRGPPLTT